jgi:hypothetical protein
MAFHGIIHKKKRLQIDEIMRDISLNPATRVGIYSYNLADFTLDLRTYYNCVFILELPTNIDL